MRTTCPVRRNQTCRVTLFGETDLTWTKNDLKSTWSRLSAKNVTVNI